MYAHITVEDWVSPYPGTGLASSHTGHSLAPWWSLSSRSVKNALYPIPPDVLLSGWWECHPAALQPVMWMKAPMWIFWRNLSGEGCWNPNVDTGCAGDVSTIWSPQKMLVQLLWEGWEWYLEMQGQRPTLFLRHGLMVVINWGDWGGTVHRS